MKQVDNWEGFHFLEKIKLLLNIYFRGVTLKWPLLISVNQVHMNKFYEQIWFPIYLKILISSLLIKSNVVTLHINIHSDLFTFYQIFLPLRMPQNSQLWLIILFYSVSYHIIYWVTNWLTDILFRDGKLYKALLFVC